MSTQSAGPRSGAEAPRIAVEPADLVPDWLRQAVVEAGGHVVGVHDADALVWFDVDRPQALLELLDEHPSLAWVQLPWAGIDKFVDYLDDERVWTCAKGAFADACAEHALALALAGVRRVGEFARAQEWGDAAGGTLFGARVSILGGGGIAQSLVRLLQPFGCHITVVRSSAQEMDGVDEVLEADRYVDALPGADVVFLALALTPETDQIIGRGELESMESHSWLVNVARGRHVVTDDLVDALERNVIAGAALDVVDPEPLPADHPLWTLPNCILTPHTATTPDTERVQLAERVTANVRRFRHGEPLLGVVDTGSGY